MGECTSCFNTEKEIIIKNDLRNNIEINEEGI